MKDRRSAAPKPAKPKPEGAQILDLLIVLDELAAPPRNGSKAKLKRVGRISRRIRNLIFKGVKKQINEDQNGMLSPENME